MIDSIIENLSGPLTSEEISNGWTEDSQRVMTDFFKDLQSKISNKEELSYFGILRGLDHWGISGGELFLKVAAIDHRLREAR